MDKQRRQSAEDCLLVITNCPSESVAQLLATRLVSDGLAACVQQGSPMTSVYCWQGELCNEREYPLWIKTTQARYAEVERTILAQHPYELPEIIALPITQALPGYLNWIKDNTR